MNHFISGFFYLFQGFGLITKPGVKRFVIIPAFINLILFIGLFFLLRHYMHEFNVWIAHLLPRWLQWLKIIFWLIFFLGFFLFFIYAFVAIGNIITAPFNSLLSEKVEFLLTKREFASRSLLENIKDIPRIIKRQLKIVGYYLLRATLLLILFFVPIIHIIVPIIWFLFSAWFMTMTYLDYPTDNHRVSLEQLREWLKTHRYASFGFGISVLLASMIPVVNFFIIPAAVAGATKFWVDANS